MNVLTRTEKYNYPGNRRPYFFNWVIRFTVLVMVLIFLGAVYESGAEYSDTQAYPPPGRLIDVGGYRLHINCTGTGSPTVVIEAGWGDSSSAWGWVQPEVAKTMRVCTYDRAGTGWSEVSSQPRTAREFAKELHTLLEKSGEQSPYVLVGHSLGAYTVRVYAHDFPDEVAGVVFIDPQNLSDKNDETYSPAPKPGRNSLPSLLARIGVVRLLAGPLGSVQNLPEDVKNADTANAVTPKFVQTYLDEAMGMSEGGAQTKAVTTLGTLPITVLSRGKDMDTVTSLSHERYLHLSTNSQHLIAHQSGHRIMIEQPDAAIDAIVKMADRIRGKV